MKKLIMFLLLISIFSLVFAVDSTINKSTQALSVSELQQGALMENAVNVKTPGYRTVRIVPYTDQATGQKTVRRTNVFSSGSLIITNRPFDLGMEGKGFFVLSDAQGRVYFTRDGRFQLNSNMQMVSLAGNLFLLDESDSIIGLPGVSDVKVDEKGYIYNLSSEVITKIKVVDVQNYNKLRSINNVIFYLGLEDEEQLFNAENFNIRQGSYESSNVDYNKLMVDLAAKSLYTANTQMIQTRLKMLDSLNGLVNQN